jgi:hypothetical protein
MPSRASRCPATVRRIAAVSADKLPVRVRNAADGVLVGAVTVPVPVRRLAVAADGTRFATAGDEPLAAACSTLPAAANCSIGPRAERRPGLERLPMAAGPTGR